MHVDTLDGVVGRPIVNANVESDTVGADALQEDESRCVGGGVQDEPTDGRLQCRSLSIAHVFHVLFRQAETETVECSAVLM